MPDDEADPRQAWPSEYAAWEAEQDDADEVNRLLNEANDDDR
jgi:hypothetical protein